MAERWRAEKNGVFYSIIFLEISDSFMVVPYTERYDDLCYSLYKKGNYFRTEEEAQAAADNMQKVLLRQSGELHDFTWAVDEMKKGNKVRCWMWGVLCYLEIKHLYEGSNSYEIFDQKGNYYELSLSDLEATDWEIYEEPTE